MCLKPGHLNASSYSTPLTSAGALFCETMRIERRRSKTWQTCLDSAAARSSGVHARPITNLQALQTESIVPSQFHRRVNGSPGEVRKVKNFWDSGPLGAVAAQPTVSKTNRNRMGTIVGTEFQVNGSQHVLDSLLSDLKVARNVCVRVPIKYQLEQRSSLEVSVTRPPISPTLSGYLCG